MVILLENKKAILGLSFILVFSFVLIGCCGLIPESLTQIETEETGFPEEPAAPANVELCSDGLDNDGDGCWDDEDSDCGGKETKCNDDIDNNCNGLTDCADMDDCELKKCGTIGCNCYQGEKVEEYCGDNNDGDNDGLTDCEDPDCQFGSPSLWDGADICWEDTCNDGLDNDNDGLADCSDSDCAVDPLCS